MIVDRARAAHAHPRACLRLTARLGGAAIHGGKAHAILAFVAVGWGALAFAAVVVLTQFAARTFDERLLWETSP